jgi:hypothetical protein
VLESERESAEYKDWELITNREDEFIFSMHMDHLWESSNVCWKLFLHILSGQGMKLTTDLHLVPMLRMIRVVSLLSLTILLFLYRQRDNFMEFTNHIMLVYLNLKLNFKKFIFIFTTIRNVCQIEELNFSSV